MDEHLHVARQLHLGPLPSFLQSNTRQFWPLHLQMNIHWEYQLFQLQSTVQNPTDF